MAVPSSDFGAHAENRVRVFRRWRRAPGGRDSPRNVHPGATTALGSPADESAGTPRRARHPEKIWRHSHPGFLELDVALGVDSRQHAINEVFAIRYPNLPWPHGPPA